MYPSPPTNEDNFKLREDNGPGTLPGEDPEIISSAVRTDDALKCLKNGHRGSVSEILSGKDIEHLWLKAENTNGQIRQPVLPSIPKSQKVECEWVFDVIIDLLRFTHSQGLGLSYGQLVKAFSVLTEEIGLEPNQDS